MFLKDDLKVLNVITLKKLCKKKSIQNISKMKKTELFEELNKLFAAKIIQKQVRNHLYKNAVDSISLENVSYPCFIYRVKTGKICNLLTTCPSFGFESPLSVIRENCKLEFRSSKLSRIHFYQSNLRDQGRRI